MGAVPKASGGIRNNTDCSRPKGSSINSFRNEFFFTLTYKSLDDVTMKLNHGMFMAVTDYFTL